MSYEILYDRLYIKAGEDLYMPVLQSGSNNCFEVSWSGREIPEKNWANQTGFKNLRTMKPFRTKEELAELGKEYAELNEKDETLWKSRYKCWDSKALASFIANGWKEALTVEEYCKLGAQPCVEYYFHEPASDKRIYGYVLLNTTAQLLYYEAYAMGKAREKYPDVAMRNFYAYVSFTSRDAKKCVKRRTMRKRVIKKLTDDYYIIGNAEQNKYYVKRSSRRVWSTVYQEYAHRFATLKGALKALPWSIKELGYTTVFHAVKGNFTPVSEI